MPLAMKSGKNIQKSAFNINIHTGQYYQDGNLVPTCFSILSVKTVLLSLEFIFSTLKVIIYPTYFSKLYLDPNYEDRNTVFTDKTRTQLGTKFLSW